MPNAEKVLTIAIRKDFLSNHTEEFLISLSDCAESNGSLSRLMESGSIFSKEFFTI
jgi:uncharacterized protein (DUF1778 family)